MFAFIIKRKKKRSKKGKEGRREEERVKNNGETKILSGKS